jgi:hypothetical protein
MIEQQAPGSISPDNLANIWPEFDADDATKNLKTWQEARGWWSPEETFLCQRGIALDIADRLGYGFCEEKSALVIPTFWQRRLIGVKFRSLSANPKWKWQQIPNSKSDILMGADLDPIDPVSTVVGVFEAPLDLALVLSLGFNAVTLISSHVPETERFLSGIEALKSKYDHILLIGDSDEPGLGAMLKMRELIGPGAAFAAIPDPHKDIGDFFQADREAAKTWLKQIYATAADCRPIPRGTLTEKLGERLSYAAAVLADSDPLVLIPTLKNDLAALTPTDEGFPKPLGGAALSGVTGEFVAAALPFTEASAEALAYQFLTAMGNCMGTTLYANFGADRHYPALFSLVVGNTASGKGQSLTSVRSLMKLVDPEWEAKHWRSSAASGEGLVRLASENTGDGRLFLSLPEMSTLLNSMNREGSNLSGYLRLAYDRSPLENQKSKGGIVARDYLLSAVGHITPAELTETLGNVDFYNGAVNRFLWVAVRKSKTLPRMSQTPDFAGLAQKLRGLLELPPAGSVYFSPGAERIWDDWVFSLPEMEGKLEAACERSKPNALRTALIYAALDNCRLMNRNVEIRDDHVRAAIEIVTRSRQSVAWFLSQPIKIDARAGYEDIVKARTAANQNGGQLTGTQVAVLFSNKSSEQRAEILSRAGFKLRKGVVGEKGGRPSDVWHW